jgi:hypothetical protein
VIWLVVEVVGGDLGAPAANAGKFTVSKLDEHFKLEIRL